MANPVENWTAKDVSEWLLRSGFVNFMELFASQQIDGEVLLTLTEEDLRSPPFNIRVFGPMRKLNLAINRLKKENEEEKMNLASVNLNVDQNQVENDRESRPPSGISDEIPSRDDIRDEKKPEDVSEKVENDGNLVKIDQISLLIDQNLTEIVQNSIEIAANSNEIGQNLVENVQNMLEKVENLLENEQKTGEIQNSTENGTLNNVEQPLLENVQNVLEKVENLLENDQKVNENVQKSDEIQISNENGTLNNAEQPQLDEFSQIIPEDSFTNEFSQNLLSNNFAIINNLDADAAGPCPISAENELLARISKLELAFPEVCWGYPLSQEHLLTVVDFDCKASPKKCTNVGGFVAEVSYFVSPVEVYVQPDFLHDTIDDLIVEMTEFYRKYDYNLNLPVDDIFEGMPCAVRFREDNRWYRAVVAEKGMEDARVIFIDWGNSQFEPYSGIKPLQANFGLYPPLTFRCRIFGVKERTLVQKVVDTFKNEIENVLDRKVYCVPRKFDNGILTISLINPMNAEDLGKKYLPKEPICPICPNFLPFSEDLPTINSALESSSSVSNNTISETQSFSKVEFEPDVEVLSEGDGQDQTAPEPPFTLTVAKKPENSRSVEPKAMLANGFDSPPVNGLDPVPAIVFDPPPPRAPTSKIADSFEGAFDRAHLFNQKRCEEIRLLTQEAEKFDKNYYACDMEAFLAGALSLDDYDETDDDSDDDRKTSKKKPKPAPKRSRQEILTSYKK